MSTRITAHWKILNPLEAIYPPKTESQPVMSQLSRKPVPTVAVLKRIDEVQKERGIGCDAISVSQRLAACMTALF